MNYLYCKVNKDQSYFERDSLSNDEQEELTSHTYSSTKVQLEAQRVAVNEKQSKSVKLYKHVVISIVGEIHNLKDFKSENLYEDDLDVIAEIYMNFGVKGLNQLDGFFTISIFDNKLLKVFIIQDRHTSLNHLYYYSDNNALYLSSDVKLLLKKTKIVPKVNKDALPTYLHYAFVPGNETLFQDVYKLPTEMILEYDFHSNQLSLLPNPYFNEYSPTEDKEKGLVQTFDDALHSRMKEIESKQIAVMFSGGYDSNFLLSRMLKYRPDLELKLFSYGSTSSKSEIHNIRRIVDI